MGMYDSVYFQCKRCHGQIEAQSKAGPCTLNTWAPETAPLKVLADLDGEEVCCQMCGASFKVQLRAVVVAQLADL